MSEAKLTSADFARAIYSGLPATTKASVDIRQPCDLWIWRGQIPPGKGKHRAGTYIVPNPYRADAVRAAIVRTGDDAIVRYRSGLKREDIGLLCVAFAEIDDLAKPEQLERWEWFERETGVRVPVLVDSGTTDPEVISAFKVASEDVEPGKSIHGFFPLMPTDVVTWTDIQRHLIVLFRSDPAIINPDRLMRLGGVVGRSVRDVPPVRVQALLRAEATPIEAARLLSALKGLIAREGVTDVEAAFDAIVYAAQTRKIANKHPDAAGELHAIADAVLKARAATQEQVARVKDLTGGDLAPGAKSKGGGATRLGTTKRTLQPGTMILLADGRSVAIDDRSIPEAGWRCYDPLLESPGSTSASARLYPRRIFSESGGGRVTYVVEQEELPTGVFGFDGPDEAPAASGVAVPAEDPHTEAEREEAARIASELADDAATLREYDAKAAVEAEAAIVAADVAELIEAGKAHLAKRDAELGRYADLLLWRGVREGVVAPNPPDRATRDKEIDALVASQSRPRRKKERTVKVLGEGVRESARAVLRHGEEFEAWIADWWKRLGYEARGDNCLGVHNMISSTTTGEQKVVSRPCRRLTCRLCGPRQIGRKLAAILRMPLVDAEGEAVASALGVRERLFVHHVTSKTAFAAWRRSFLRASKSAVAESLQETSGPVCTSSCRDSATVDPAYIAFSRAGETFVITSLALGGEPIPTVELPWALVVLTGWAFEPGVDALGAFDIDVVGRISSSRNLCLDPEALWKAANENPWVVEEPYSVPPARAAKIAREWCFRSTATSWDRETTLPTVVSFGTPPDDHERQRRRAAVRRDGVVAVAPQRDDSGGEIDMLVGGLLE